MNKILLTLALFIAFIAKISSQCLPVPVPFLESFSTGTLPNCWISQNPTSTSTNANVKWKFTGGASGGATGNGGKPSGTFAWVDASAPYVDEQNVELITAQINLTGIANPYVKFEWFKNHLSSLTNVAVPNFENNQLKVEVNDGTGWVQIWASNTNNSKWRTVGIPLASIYLGATIQLKFTVDKDVSGNGNTYDDILLDEVQVIERPACIEPTGLHVTNLSPNSGTINWALTSTPAPANGYEYYYTTTNTPPVVTTPGMPTQGTRVNLTSLIPGTTYYWWIRAVCSATEKSVWVEGNSFLPGQIGSSSTLANSTLPVSSCSGFNYSQQIYTASEIGGVLGANNYITSIKFYVSATASVQANYNQWVIYMGNTAQTDFATTTSWVPSSSLMEVYSGTLPPMIAGTWVEIPLSSPFLWDGTSNVVIAVDENSPGGSCSADWGSYNAGINRGMSYSNATINPNAAIPPTALTRFLVIPIMQMTGTNLPSCTTASPTGIAMSNISATSVNVSWIPTAGATYVLRYRILPGGAWTTINIPSSFTNSYNINGLLPSTQYEVEMATVCNAGSAGIFSTPVSFTTSGFSWCSQSALSGAANTQWISNVTVTPTGGSTILNNTSAQSPYTDYSTNPALELTLIRGSQNNKISVGKKWNNAFSANYTKVWIDFDRNGIFDAGELIYSDGPSIVTPVGGTFDVPNVTYSGSEATRMRVVVSSSAAGGACYGVTSGEIEDYAIRFVDLQPCSTTAPVPIVSNITITSSAAYVSWINTANATYRIRWRQQGTAPWVQPTSPLGYVELPAGQSWYTITGLLEQSTYEVQLQAKCGNTWGAFGASVNFTTPTLTYCSMVGAHTTDYISNVQVTPVSFPVMDNTSIQTNYISYTAPATLVNLEIGSVGNQLSVSKVTSAASAVYAWIDFDRDGIFTDAERIMTSATNISSPITATFNVPSTGIYTGPYTTTMRVALKRGSAPTMCSSPLQYGEVEDYAVRLRPCSSIPPTNITLNSITHNSATINWMSAINSNTFIIEYKEATASTWNVISASSLTGGPPVQLTGLSPATNYEVRIASVCGGAAGIYTTIQTFTTKCDPSPPNVTISNITSNSAVVTWNPIVANATYILRWREEGTVLWNTPAIPQPPSNSYTITGLNSNVTYEIQVANQCIGEITPNSWSIQVFTTERVCEGPPTGLTISTLTSSSAEIVWDTFPGATYILRYRKVGIPSWTNVPVSTNTYTITGLLELTKYEMQVANVCNGTSGNYTPLYYFTTPTVIYCQMVSANSATEFISKVTAKPTGKPEMINESLSSGYSDFTGIPSKYIEMIQGSIGNQIIIDKTLSSVASVGVAVWIDFNRNGSFDLDERILADGPNTNPTSSATFNVPADAFVSTTDYKYIVMRVALQKDGIPVNCVSFKNGEVEDYTVRISKVPVVNALNQNDIMVYPNPVKSILNVKNISKKGNYKIYNAAGQLVANGLILNNAVNVSGLINGVYTIDIQDVKGSAQKKFIKE